MIKRTTSLFHLTAWLPRLVFCQGKHVVVAAACRALGHRTSDLIVRDCCRLLPVDERLTRAFAFFMSRWRFLQSAAMAILCFPLLLALTAGLVVKDHCIVIPFLASGSSTIGAGDNNNRDSSFDCRVWCKWAFSHLDVAFSSLSIFLFSLLANDFAKAIRVRWRCFSKLDGIATQAPQGGTVDCNVLRGDSFSLCSHTFGWHW